MPASDAELIDAYARDQSEAPFVVLYDRHAPAMYALARRLLGDRDRDAADVLQESWLRAIPKLGTFRYEASLRTWLCGFVVNCCRERFRAVLFEPIDVAPSLPPAEPDVDLERALRALPDGYRAVIVLHDIEGYTHREIAGVLGIEEGTSKSQLSRARSVLRHRLSMRGQRPAV